MERSNLNRRDFSKLTLAAAGGLMTGALAGCSGDKPAAPPATGGGGTGGAGGGTGTTGASGTGETAAGAGADEFANWGANDKHVCRGLNMCKNLDVDGENACAGQGDCATAAEHSCHKENECKGQGGCGETVGINACKGQGECGVPLKPESETWAKARAIFEQVAEAQGKTVGEAPPAAE